jgi:hypothetical protein
MLRNYEKREEVKPPPQKIGHMDIFDGKLVVLIRFYPIKHMKSAAYSIHMSKDAGYKSAMYARF